MTFYILHYIPQQLPHHQPLPAVSPFRSREEMLSYSPLCPSIWRHSPLRLTPGRGEAGRTSHSRTTPPPESSISKSQGSYIQYFQDNLVNEDGLKYYDLIVGKGPQAERGSTVQVHFDCVYRGITAVSSRESKLLAGNRSIAQPYEFIVGSPPGKERKREYVDSANGLYSAQAAPKPPPALYTITEGMRKGGKRVVIVPPEVGYGKRGMNEIPPDSTFELNVELLQIVPPAGK